MKADADPPTTRIPANRNDRNSRLSSSRQPGNLNRGKARKPASIIENIFATRQLAPKGDREVYIRYTVRELVVYLLYLLTLCLLTFGVTSTVTYDYTKVLYDLFLDEPIIKPGEASYPQSGSERTFRSSIHVLDFWLFVTNVLPHYLFWENLYGSNIGTGSKGKGNHFVRYRFENESTGILYQNVLLGVARFRQLRVRSLNCPTVRDYRHLSRDQCYPPYKPEFEDMGKGKPREWEIWRDVVDKKRDNISRRYTREAFKYKSEAELKGSSHWGKLATYSGGGAIQELGRNFNLTVEIIKELRQSLWIHRSTRVVFLDFTIYNSNLNLFCVVRLAWEFSPVGGMTTSWSLRTLRLLRYVEFIDYALILPCEIAFCVFTLYYLIQEMIELHHLGCKGYFFDIWSWVDLGILVLSMICIGFSVYRYILVNETLQSITSDPEKFPDFEFLGFWQTQFNHAVSICVFFSWVKIFKYISFNKTMTQLSSTLSRCAKDIGGFGIMFFVCFFAFAQLGYLLFGSQLHAFSTFQDSIITLLRLILGDFNFRQLEAANRILGPIYFLSYVFFVFFVLLNMFLAIINDTYSEVKAEIQAQRNEFEMADYFLGVWNNLLGCFGKRNAQLDAENEVKLAAADGQITYEELRAHLKSCHFSEVEIEMFLARYELDTDHSLDDKEILTVLDNLEGINRHEELMAVVQGDTIDNPRKMSQPEADYIIKFKELHERIIKLESAVTIFIGKLKSLKSHIEERKKQEYEQASNLLKNEKIN